MRHAQPGNKVIGHDDVLMHMVQHVLLGAVAPPLLWLIVRRTCPRIVRGALTPLGRLLTHPVATWLAGTVTVIGWHVPAAFELGQRSAMWHSIQGASFFVTGLLFWWPVVRPWPAAVRLSPPMIPLYLFTATLPCDALSAFLVFCDRVVYPGHLAEPGHFSVAALADQETAGAFMWMAITFIYLVPAIVLTVQALSPAQRREPSATTASDVAAVQALRPSIPGGSSLRRRSTMS
jgi:putative membrane protein